MPLQDYVDLAPGPDLHPLYPTPQYIDGLLGHIDPDHRHTLIAHAFSRAITFADLAVLTYLLRNHATRPLIDLRTKDEDGLGPVSLSILGFGEECDRDIEREECVRLLVAEGADIHEGDIGGWTPLHFAALHAPATLISHLLARGASPLTVSHKGLTPLDVITAYEALPQRSDVATLLEEAMRSQGWYGNERERRRDRKRMRKLVYVQKTRRRKDEWGLIGRTLDLQDRWWGETDVEGSDVADSDAYSDSEEEEDDDEDDDPVPYTPPRHFNSMLVFALQNLPSLLDTLIEQAQPVVRPLSSRAAPANGLYYLTRFACICCDPTWVEEVIVGALDKIQDTIRARPEDLPHLAFWLFNTTLFLHLLSCDNDVNAVPDVIELFELAEEVINAIYVFIIRVIEKRIDTLIDPALLDYSPLASEFESVQFESEWSFFRSLTTPKRKAASPPSSKSGTPLNGSPTVSHTISNSSISQILGGGDSRSSSPVPSIPEKSPAAKAFSSLRFRSNPAAPTSPVKDTAFSSHRHSQSISSISQAVTPSTITSLLTALHTLLSVYGINPILIIQANSQILYWTSCELFNRLISRKKYLCRSRAMQIGMNISIIEEWVVQVGLPKGVASHFAGARQLITWLQCLSSISDFPHLIDIIQTMKALNPLQMRRAVKDYRYEVNEGRMTEECNQYLAQMQKDWERQRIKLGVEQARKERQREREEEISSSDSNEMINGDADSQFSDSKLRERDEAQRMIDNLFDPERPRSEWMPPQPPEPLGELMNSRYMIPLIFPSDPALLCAYPGVDALHPPMAFTAGMDSFIATRPPSPIKKSRKRPVSASISMLRDEVERSHSRASSHASHSSIASLNTMGSVSRRPMGWRNRDRKLREVEPELLDLVGGATEAVWDVFGVRFLASDMQVSTRDVRLGWADGLEATILEEEGPIEVRPEEATGSTELLASPIEVDDNTPADSRIVGLGYAPSIASSRSNHSHLTTNPLRPTAEKRRSIRLARRSSGGETAMPMFEDLRDSLFDETPTVENIHRSFA